MEQMPTPNSDSLAFIMSHLLKISQNSNHNLMDVKALSKIFGPTIVGYSGTDLPMEQMCAQTLKQIQVMEAFFRVPEETYQQLLYSAELSKRKSIL